MCFVWKDLLSNLGFKADLLFFSSPRAKRAGPKGLRAESARALTGRRCPHSGKGEDFLTGQPDFFTETVVTPEEKVEKFLDQKPKFWAQKKGDHFWGLTMFWPRPEKVVRRKKLPLPK